MLDYEEKRLIKRIIYSKVTIFIVAVLLFLVSRGTWKAYGDAKMTKENSDLAVQELNELKGRESVIENQIAELSTLEGREKEIRSKFQVAKEGEKMIMIVDSKPDYPDTKPDKGFFEKLKSLFKF